LAEGLGSLSATQDIDSSQTISLQASGQGMSINFTSNLEGNAGTDLVVTGAIADVESSGEAVADIIETSVSTNIAPISELGLAIEGADTVGIQVSGQTLGWEQVDAEVYQGAQVFTGDSVPAGFGGWKKQ